MFRSTLDIDFTDKWNRFRPLDYGFISQIITKVMFLCNYFIYYTISDSSFKGMHIELFCSKKCDICRLCYDDTKRLAYDSNRPEYARNVLFEKKERVKIE